MGLLKLLGPWACVMLLATSIISPSLTVWHGVLGLAGLSNGGPLDPVAKSGEGITHSWRSTGTAELAEDRTPPTITITSPANGSLIGTSDITIEFSSPDTDVHHFEISIDGGSWVVATSPYTARGLREGTHTVRVRAIDISGNVGEASVTFTVDTKAPVVVITSPSNGSSVYGKVKITWFIDEPNVLNVTLEVAGKKINATGLTSYTWDTTGLPDGYYTIRLTVIDKLGRTTTAEVTVKTINEALRTEEARISALKGGLVGGVIVSFLVGFLPTYFILRKRA